MSEDKTVLEPVVRDAKGKPARLNWDKMSPEKLAFEQARFNHFGGEAVPVTQNVDSLPVQEPSLK